MRPKDDVISVVEATWHRLDRSVAGLDEAALLEPGVVGIWSIKDILGHVTACDHLVVRYLERRRRSAPPPAPPASTPDLDL